MLTHYLKRVGLSLLITCTLLLPLVMLSRNAGAAGPTPAAALAAIPASTPSTGCIAYNKPLLDGQYNNHGLSPQPFVAGDRIIVTAGLPVSNPPPTTVILSLNNALFAWAPFSPPTTLTYLITTDGNYSFSWGVDGTTTTQWSISCDHPASPPPYTPTSNGPVPTNTETATPFRPPTHTRIPRNTPTSTATSTATPTATGTPTSTATPTAPPEYLPFVDR